jgi:hypothetical protein
VVPDQYRGKVNLSIEELETLVSNITGTDYQISFEE